jgi:hypothetical protein
MASGHRAELFAATAELERLRTRVAVLEAELEDAHSGTLRLSVADVSTVDASGHASRAATRGVGPALATPERATASAPVPAAKPRHPNPHAPRGGAAVRRFVGGEAEEHDAPSQPRRGSTHSVASDSASTAADAGLHVAGGDRADARWPLGSGADGNAGGSDGGGAWAPSAARGQSGAAAARDSPPGGASAQSDAALPPRHDVGARDVRRHGSDSEREGDGSTHRRRYEGMLSALESSGALSTRRSQSTSASPTSALASTTSDSSADFVLSPQLTRPKAAVHSTDARRVKAVDDTSDSDSSTF